MMRIKVTYFQRKPLSYYISLESIFNSLRIKLNSNIEPITHICRFHSKGIFSRFLNIVFVYFNRGNINHIAGDIHYTCLLLNKNRTILTIADCGFMECKFKIKRFLLWFIMLYIPSKKVKYITTISNFNKQTIIKYLPKFPEDNIFVIPVSVSESFIYNYKNYNFKIPTILQIGTAPNKNISRLFKSIINIPCKLIIVGKLSNDHLNLLNENNIQYENYVNISNKELINLYMKADILSFISTYEGFGMPIIEANIMGLVVITSNLCSMPEVASNSAILVDPFDLSAIRNALLSIINNEKLRLELLRNGYQNCKRFEADVIADMYLNLYKKIQNSLI